GTASRLPVASRIWSPPKALIISFGKVPLRDDRDQYWPEFPSCGTGAAGLRGRERLFDAPLTLLPRAGSRLPTSVLRHGHPEMRRAQSGREGGHIWKPLPSIVEPKFPRPTPKNSTSSSAVWSVISAPLPAAHWSSSA